MAMAGAVVGVVAAVVVETDKMPQNYCGVRMRRCAVLASSPTCEVCLVAAFRAPCTCRPDTERRSRQAREGWLADAPANGWLAPVTSRIRYPRDVFQHLVLD